MAVLGRSKPQLLCKLDSGARTASTARLPLESILRRVGLYAMRRDHELVRATVVGVQSAADALNVWASWAQCFEKQSASELGLPLPCQTS
jgi:hypothetical protein